MLIMQWPHGKKEKVTWRSELLQILQEVGAIYKTRNQLIGRGVESGAAGDASRGSRAGPNAVDLRHSLMRGYSIKALIY
jgi:hypothetical protein